jgi:hypothetical protein
MKTFAEGVIPGKSQLPAGQLVFTGVGAKAHESKAIRSALESWQKLVRSDPNPIARDAAELARLAYGKWAYYRSALEIGATLIDVLAKIRDNPNAEVAVLLLAKAPQLKDRRVRMRIAGVCLFRRTWCNNVFIDFLARHPLDPVKGAGTRLLYYVARIASVIQADAIWGETTQNSVGYYAKAFGEPEIKDLLYVRRDKYEAFWKRTDELQREAKGNG